MDRPEAEIDVPLDRWFDLSEEVLAARAETWGDVIAQHRVITHYQTPLSLGIVEERWIVGLGDSIRRLAGAS